MTNLRDLPDFGNQKQQFNFDGFDEDVNQIQDQGYTQNAEKFLNDYENEAKQGFKVEVQRPGTRGKGSSPGDQAKKSFADKFGQHRYDNNNDDEMIEEDIQTEREKDSQHDNKIESSIGHQAGITVSQSLGIDPSVDSLALDEYDHIEVVET